jgi:hypothetical protein
MHWINPESLPETSGTVELFVLNPHGEVDGFVMRGENKSDILVHTPPHMEKLLTRHVKPGDKVSVHGVRPRGTELLAAVAVTAASGHQIVDEGPDHDRAHPHVAHEKTEAEGRVRLSLFGPKGELRGALLTDGTVVRMGPKEAEPVAKLLRPGAALAVRGDGVRTRHGRVIHAKEVGADQDDLQPVKAPNHKHKPKHKHDGRAAHA